MTSSEKVKELIEGLKACPEADIDKYFKELPQLFPLLSGPEKRSFAEDMFTSAKENAAQQPLKFAYAQYLVALADYFTERYEHLLVIANEARAAFEAFNKPDEVALCLAFIGGTYRTLGNIDLALKALWESYGQLNKTGEYVHIAFANAFNIAGIYVERKNYEEAFPLYQATLERAERVGNQLFIINSLQGLGRLYLQLKEYDKAKDALERSLSVADRLGLPMFIANLQTDLANYHFETGNYEEATRLHSLALASRHEHNLVDASITNMMQLADINVLEGKNDEAIAILDKALGMAQQLKVKPKLYQLHLKLSEVYQAKGDTEKSLYHFKLFHDIREQVEVEDAAKKIKNLQLVFEAEQTRKENIIIKKQKAEIEQKNIELQETIDELTRAKVSKKAKALTLIVALILFITEDVILDFVLHRLPEDNILLTLGAKILIVFSLKPIERGIEHYLLSKVIKKKRKEVLV